MKKLILLLSCFSALILPYAMGQVNITANQTAAVLSQKLAGQGITISNPVLNCPSAANGVFSVVSSNLGLDSGIILTSGRAATAGNNYGANGPQFAGVNNNASLNNGAPGDADLNALANSTTRDACILEFDLVPKGDTVKFDYVFGSEEYWKSTCGSYNDAFAFFISGPGITGMDNMALVPGTNIPVTVNSINSGIPGTQGNIANCYAMGTGSPFTAYYIDNSVGTTVTYYGFTTVLTAMHAVQPCSTYHLKLTIADAGNFLYDSGVFLKAGSLKTSTFHLQSQSGTTLNDTIVIKGCNPGRFIFNRSEIRSAPQTLKFLIAGTATNGLDYATIADSVVIPANDSIATLFIQGLNTGQTGDKILKLYLYSPYSCNGLEIIDSAFLKITDPLQANIITPDTTVCFGSSFPILVNGDNNLQYAWTPSQGLSSASVKEPLATPPADITYVMTATLPGSGCPPIEDSIRITVVQPPAVNAGPDQTICTGASLSLAATVSPQNNNYTYQWTGPAGFTAAAPTADLPSATTDNSGIYTLTVGIPGCTPTSDDVIIYVSPQLVAYAGEDLALCHGDTLRLVGAAEPAGQYVYQWTGPDGYSSNQSVAVLGNVSAVNNGNYILTVSDNHCAPATDNVFVRIKPVPEKPEHMDGYPPIYCKGSEAKPLKVWGLGLLWYEGESSEPSMVPPVPSTDNIGVQQFYVRQTEENCLSEKQLVEVFVEQCCDDRLFIPTVFSPNGDGKNDVLTFVHSPYHRLLFVNVFNRWGECVFIGNSTLQAWDGLYKGQPVDAGNYYYQLSAECKDGTAVERTGEVMVVR